MTSGGAELAQAGVRSSMTSGQRKHPSGAMLLAFAEMWERFSFFGMKGILVLFLTASISDGGFGWEPARAVAFTGVYGGLVYLAGVGGGWLADRVIGLLKSVFWGGFILVSGHLLLGGVDLGPVFVELITGQDVKALLIEADASLGAVRIDDATKASLTAIGTPEQAAAAAFSMTLSASAFYVGILFVIIGTGLFKTPLTVLLGRLYDDREAMRDEGFTLYYVGMNIGSFAAPLVVGSLAESVGWAWGFAAAAVGMVVAMIVVMARRGVLPPIDVKRTKAANVSLTRKQRRRLLGLGILGVFAAVFWIGFEQIFGFLNIFVYENVDRSFFGFNVPATWFLSLNPIIIIALAPVLAQLWTRLERKKCNPDIVGKFILGLAALSLAFALPLISSLMGGAARFPAVVIILSYGFVTLAELLLWTTSLAFVTRIAPPQIAGAVMGAWYISLAAGASLGGIVGAIATSMDVVEAFMMLTIGFFAALVLLVLLRPRLLRLLDLNSATTAGALKGPVPASSNEDVY